MRTKEVYVREKDPFTKIARAIELKYYKLLSRHVNSLTGKGIDRLSNHYMISDSGITFRRDCYLPEFVQQEVIAAHREIFQLE